jgi:hypothetical protein
MIIPDPGSRVKKRRGQQRFMDIILAYQYTGGDSWGVFHRHNSGKTICRRGS